MADTRSGPRLRESVAGEIRVAMVRRQVTGAQLALALGKSQAYVSRRLSGETSFDVDDLETIAATLRIKVADLIGYAERGDAPYGDVGLTLPTTIRQPAVAAVGAHPHPGHPIVAEARPITMPAPNDVRRTAPVRR